MKIFRESTDPSSVGNKFRQKRMMYFLNLIRDLNKPLNILDIGGNQIFWRNAGLHNQSDYQITILNLDLQKASFENFTSVVGDATNLSQYKENQFDLVFSNSVIEHLYNKQNQVKMASEAQRVGRFHFIQTPNKYFFLEPHFLLPFFQFLPGSLKFSILTKTKLSRLKRWDKAFARQYLDEIRLLSPHEMKELFPNSKIWREKFFSVTKSIVAHNLDTPPNY